MTGVTEVSQGASLRASSCQIQGGTLTGGGLISSPVINHGDILPGDPVGPLQIAGPFTNRGRIFIETSQSDGMTNDQIIVFTDAHLGGTLSVSWRDVPPGTGFAVITCQSRTGTFARMDGLDLDQGRTLIPAYSSTGLAFDVQPGGTPLNHVSLTPWANEDLEIRFTGIAGQTYAIEWTEDLVQWTPLWQTNTPNGFLRYVDPGAFSLAHRFYRTARQP